MEALKINDQDKLRFHVHRDHGVVKFYGSIGDTPDTAALDNVLLNDSVCDMSHLAFASWIGLATLGTYIKERQLKVTFQGLPFHVYDAMRLNKDFEDQGFESAELPLVHAESRNISMEMVDLKLLRKDAEDGNDWVHPKPGFLLLIPTRYIFPDLVAQRTTGHLPVQVQTPQKEIASFWLQYGSFCQSTVEISSTLIHAAKFNMLQILLEIKAKMSASEEALKLVDSKMTFTLVHRMEAMIREIEFDFDALSNHISSKFDECEQKLAVLSLLALEPSGELQRFNLALHDYAHSVQGLTADAAACEEYGAHIGTKLASVRSTQVMKNAWSSLENPAPDTLTAIRAAFAIMDIMSEDDWPATQILIMQELKSIDDLIGRCVVTLQVFDMMRQIMEHRIREMEQILAAYQDRGHDSLLDPGLRDTVLAKIGAHMVTEQEKAAFAFYLPAGFQQFGQTERKEPGDVLLF